MVCSKDWEPRHPQDFVRGITDIQAVPWSRPESSNNFVSPCTTRSSIAKYAVAGCMIAGNTTNPGIIPPSSFTV
jgi:hypothetical protein